MKPCVHSCCCGCTLETGCIIIAWFYIVTGALGLALGIFLAVFSGSVDDDYIEGGSPEVFLIVGIVLIVITTLNIIAGILLILGVKQRDHRKMFMILVIIVLGIVSSFSNLFVSALSGIFSVLITLAIEIYFFLVIYSLYKKISDEKKGITPQNTQVYVAQVVQQYPQQNYPQQYPAAPQYSQNYYGQPQPQAYPPQQAQQYSAPYPPQPTAMPQPMTEKNENV